MDKREKYLKRVALELDRANEAKSDKEVQFLRDCGWHCTCGNPGSIWLWVKKIKGKSYRCEQSTAVFLAKAGLRGY